MPAKPTSRFYWRQTGPNCYQVFDRDALSLSRAKGSRLDGKITAYATRARAHYCVQRLRDGRQHSPFDYRLKRKRAWGTTAPT